jgi:predicted nucleotidyltransferase
MYPPLVAPYDWALREAVTFIVSRFEVIGIVASGTILRGDPGPASDLDIQVVQARPQRQRLQRFFNGVPAEIFVNPVHQVEQYLREEHEEGRPLTAHMLATGFVILQRSAVIEQLRQRARDLLAAGPPKNELDRTRRRYFAATQLEDGRDLAEVDPAAANMLLGPAVHAMVHYYFLNLGRFIPREKELLKKLAELHPELASLAQEFYESGSVARRLALAEAIADRTIGVHGFFEWDSNLDDV